MGLIKAISTYNNNNNTQIYLTSAIIQIKVKTPKLTAEASLSKHELNKNHVIIKYLLTVLKHIK